MRPITLQELMEKYPALNTYNYQRHSGGTAETLNHILAACGYRFAEGADVVRAQKDEQYDLQDYLACRLVRIEQCL